MSRYNPNHESPLSARLSRHMQLLDRAVDSATYALPLDATEYETRLWQAFDRVNGAFYHNGNALRILSEYKPHDLPPVPELPAGWITAMTGSGFTLTEERLNFEAIAFLAACKSALDFLARLAFAYWQPPYTKGSRDAIAHAFIEAAVRSNPLAKVLQAHQTELERLSRYRNHLLHRTSLHVTVKSESNMREGLYSKSLIAVILDDAPEFVPFTRHDAAHGPRLEFGRSRSEARMSGPDGTMRLTEYNEQLEPPYGYVRIQDFMANRLDILSRFFNEFVALVEGNDFHAS